VEGERLQYEPQRTAYRHQASALIIIQECIITAVLVVLCAAGNAGEVEATLCNLNADVYYYVLVVRVALQCIYLCLFRDNVLHRACMN
jgi:hypothetical protein